MWCVICVAFVWKATLSEIFQIRMYRWVCVQCNVHRLRLEYQIYTKLGTQGVVLTHPSCLWMRPFLSRTNLPLHDGQVTRGFFVG
jgi:hypothetical protein